MKKILLASAALALAFSASAARTVTKIVENERGMFSTTTLTYDTSDRLSTITDDNSTFTFDYSRLAEKKLLLTRVDRPDNEVTLYEMDLNDEGYVIKTVEYDDGELDDTYLTFGYTDGRLTSYRQVSPDEVEEDVITWFNDNISTIRNTNGDPDDAETTTVEYQYWNHYTENTFGVCLYELLYGIDLDDMEWVGFAGFLGKAPARFTCTYTVTNDKTGQPVDAVLINDVLDLDGYLGRISLYRKTDLTAEEYPLEREFVFTWEGEAGVAAIQGAAAAESSYYTIDGNKASSITKGLLLERRPDGTTVKRINR